MTIYGTLSQTNIRNNDSCDILSKNSIEMLPTVYNFLRMLHPSQFCLNNLQPDSLDPSTSICIHKSLTN